MALTKQQIIEQSNSAMNQWGDQWREHAKEHAKYDQVSFEDFQNIGVGRTLLLVANGYSFEANLETIKKYQGHVDIMACDKTLKSLLDHGITPKYCLVCDANVSYEKYCEPVKDKLDQTILFMNVAGNPKWTSGGNWAKRVFFVNEDAIASEKEFGPLSKCNNFIPAATNVSGAMVVLATQCRRKLRNNFFGYDKIVLIGFDYSWKDGNYYAFSGDAEGKDHYMRHIQLLDRDFELCYTSHNLRFSAQWLTDYIKNFDLPVVLGSGSTIVGHAKVLDLAKEMQYAYKPQDGPKVRDMVKSLTAHRLQVQKLESKLKTIGVDHWNNYKQSI